MAPTLNKQRAPSLSNQTIRQLSLLSHFHFTKICGQQLHPPSRVLVVVVGLLPPVKMTTSNPKSL
jgi:hypothetical protein